MTGDFILIKREIFNLSQELFLERKETDGITRSPDIRPAMRRIMTRCELRKIAIAR